MTDWLIYLSHLQREEEEDKQGWKQITHSLISPVFHEWFIIYQWKQVIFNNILNNLSKWKWWVTLTCSSCCGPIIIIILLSSADTEGLADIRSVDQRSEVWWMDDITALIACWLTFEGSETEPKATKAWSLAAGHQLMPDFTLGISHMWSTTRTTTRLQNSTDSHGFRMSTIHKDILYIQYPMLLVCSFIKYFG